MNTKMTLNELKAKLDLIPDELGDFEVIVAQSLGTTTINSKPDTVFLGKKSVSYDDTISVWPPADKTQANVIVIASTY